jgi:DNA-binding NarL/FixJ family response regulator
MANRFRLMVIDEDEARRRRLRNAARTLEVDVVAEAPEPAEGIVLARSAGPDAILVDDKLAPTSWGHRATSHRTLGTLSGLEAVAYIKQAAPTAVVVVCTSRSGIDRSAHNAGADLCLQRAESALVQTTH